MVIVQINTSTDLEPIIKDLDEQSIAIVEFSASWCKACSIMTPELKKVAEINPVQTFAFVDVDDCEELAIEYNVIVLPTTYFIKNKAIIETIIGARLSSLYKVLSKFKMEIPLEEKKEKVIEKAKAEPEKVIKEGPEKPREEEKEKALLGVITPKQEPEKVMKEPQRSSEEEKEKELGLISPKESVVAAVTTKSALKGHFSKDNLINKRSNISVKKPSKSTEQKSNLTLSIKSSHKKISTASVLKKMRNKSKEKQLKKGKNTEDKNKTEKVDKNKQTEKDSK